MTKIQDLCGFYTITNTKQNGKETASNIYIKKKKTRTKRKKSKEGYTYQEAIWGLGEKTVRAGHLFWDRIW